MKHALPLLLLLAACGGGEQPKLPPGAAGGAGDNELLAKAQRMFEPLKPVVLDSADKQRLALVALGRTLYHDTQLSRYGTVSCNSCHKLDAFGVDGEKTSPGDTKERGTRNSPSVYNAALHSMQFWDGRAKTVEEQAGGPILNPVEMGIPDKAFL
jgi:cytochrome c peroxidase